MSAPQGAGSSKHTGLSGADGPWGNEREYNSSLLKHSLTFELSRHDGKKALREALVGRVARSRGRENPRGKLDRPALSERPLSTASRGGRANIRIAWLFACGSRNTKIRQRP